MISPITLIATPLILAVSLTAAYLLCPEVDPALTLSISDIPIRREWPMERDRRGDLATAWEAYRHLSGIQEATVSGHFTCNIRYPILDIQTLEDLPILTKSYFGASGDLLRVDATGQFSFSWPSAFHHSKNHVHVLSFSGVREVFTDNISNDEDQLVVDWYRSWAAEMKEWAHMFVSPLENPLNPKCIKIVYFTHQVYIPRPDDIVCEGLIYDTSRLVPLYDQPQMYSTADALDQHLLELCENGSYPSFRLFNLLKGSYHSYHVTTKDLWTSIYTAMVHPVNNLPPQDIISVCLEGVPNYNGFDPGPISNSSSSPNSLLPKALIFIACATILTFCTYLGCEYFC